MCLQKGNWREPSDTSKTGDIYIKKQKADGTKGFVRNPFAPGAEYGYDSTTHEKWQQSGFVQPNVDPYSNLQQGGGFIQTNVDPYLWFQNFSLTL